MLKPPELRPVAEGATPARALPSAWRHRTATRSWSGPLDPAPSQTATAQPPPPHPEAPEPSRWLHVLRELTRCDFRARYRAQALGVLWSLLNPLVMMGILSVVFTRVFHATTPHFPIFVLIGLVVWQWVANSLPVATQVFVSQGDLVKRTVFPRHLLPASVVLSYGMNFCVEASVLLLFIPIYPGAFRASSALLVVPVLLFVLLLLLTGVAWITSVLNVIYRDVAYLVNTGLLLLYWLTPVIYPIEVIPEPYQAVLKCSPLAGILVAMRRAVMLGEWPTALGWAGILGPTALLLLLGWVVFRHYERQVLDHV